MPAPERHRAGYAGTRPDESGPSRPRAAAPTEGAVHSRSSGLVRAAFSFRLLALFPLYLVELGGYVEGVGEVEGGVVEARLALQEAHTPDEEVEEEAMRQRPSRFGSVNRTRPVVTRPRTNNPLIQIGGLNKSRPPLVAIENRETKIRGEHPSWEFFFKDVTWGGLEGLFAAALGFIRNHKWR